MIHILKTTFKNICSIVIDACGVQKSTSHLKIERLEEMHRN